MPASLKYGRRKSDPSRPHLKLASVLTGTVPAHPLAEDYLARLSGWQMLGNNVAGCCNSVTWANMRRLVTSALSTEHYPTQAQVWQFYETQNPGFNPNGSSTTNGPGSEHDQGMNVQLGLEYLQKHGGPDGVKVVAFAKVDHANPNEVKAALAIFGCLWLGINVLSQNQEQFSEGVAWTDVPGASVEGGHAILGGGYNTDIKFITWGQETEFALSFWNGTADGEPLVEEAWVAIWPEHLGAKAFEQGINRAALATAYQELTGKTLPLPAPPPAPADPDSALEAAIHIAGLSQVKPAALANALSDWMAAKGAAAEVSVRRHAEMIHAEHHPGTFVPTLDSCPAHDRGEYEDRVREMHSR